MKLTNSQEYRIAELYLKNANKITFKIIKEINHVDPVKEIANKIVSDFVKFLVHFNGEMEERDLLKLQEIVISGLLEISGKVDYFTPSNQFVLETILQMNEASLLVINILNE
tara:strand:- start:1539 stop:1874 length:336 start_codon:yes stop_codon:yes gene_type:complete